MTTGERVIGLAPATEMEARQLRLRRGASILLLRLLAFDAQGRPIEYMTSVNHPQLVVFDCYAHRRVEDFFLGRGVGG